MSRPVMHAFRLMSSLSSSISEPCAALNMATPLPSLVDSDARTLAAAPFLFLPGELEAEFIGDPAMQGQYSGERLHAERPEIYAEVINMLDNARRWQANGDEKQQLAAGELLPKLEEEAASRKAARLEAAQVKRAAARKPKVAAA